MKRITKLFITLLILSCSIKAHAQTASATWGMASNASVSVSGNVTAGNQAGGSDIGTMSYGAGNGVTSVNWGSASQNVNDYYQFTISPTAGKGLTVTSISTTNNTSPGGVDNILLQYSLSASFTSPVTIGNPAATGTSSFNSLTINAANGQTIYVRMFAWGAANETNKTFSCKNFIISGTTLTCPSSPAAGSNSPVCAGSNINLNSSATGTSLTYSWSGPNSFSSSSQNPAISSSTTAAAGTYTITVSNACGSVSTTTNVAVNALTSIASVVSNETCSLHNGSATVTVNGGISPYSYSWSNGSSSQSISGLTQGIYSVTVTDANGCSTLTSASVSNNSPAITANVSSTNATCSENNGIAAAGATGGAEPYSYSWSNGSTSRQISGISAGNYSVTITDANGCTATSSATISNSSSAITATISASPFVCSGINNGTATITANGGDSPYGYNWSNGATSQAVADLSPGTYSVIVTDANGCSASESVTIASKSAPVQPDQIIATGAPTAVCPPVNGVVLQTNNDPGATAYSWSTESPGIAFVTPSTTNVQTINIGTSSSSTYTVRVTASNECGASPYKAILFRRAVSVPDIHGPATVCANTTQTYSCNSVGATTYKWSGTAGMLINGNAAPYISADTFVTVTYTAAFNTGTLSVSGSLGCFTSANRNLSVSKNVPALSSISGPSPACPQSSQTYTIPAVPGAVTYLWTLPANSTGSSSTNSITVNFGNFIAAGNICVKAVNNCGMQSNMQCKSITAGLPAVPGAIAGPATQVCGLKTYSVPALPGITYNWTIPINTSIESGQGTNSVTVNFSSGFTSGSISVTASNSCGNSTARTLAVNSAVSPPGTITGEYSLVCAGETKTYSVPTVTGISFNWTAPANASIESGQGTNSVTVRFNTGFTSGSLSASATNGCANSAARTLVITSLPSTPGAITGPSAQVCAGSSKSYSITAVSGVTYNWTAPANAVISAGQGTNNVTVDFNNSFISGTLSVVAVAPCGSSPAKTLMITSLLPSPVSISGPVNNNCGITSLFTIRKAANATSYSWRTSVPGAVINSEPAPNDTAARITFPSFTTGTVSVGTDNTCGTSPLKTLTVSGTPSTPGIITTNPSPVCANATDVQFTSDVSSSGSGCTFLWTYPSSATYVSGQGTSTLVLNWGTANGTVTLKATNSCGNSVRSYNVIVGCARVTGNNGQNSNEVKGSSQTIGPIDDNSFNLQAYPDADQKTVTFTFHADKEGSYKYTLYDDSNREIMNGNINAQKGVNMQELDMASSPPDSVYRLKLDNGKKSTHINIKMK
ncbi:MAG TPA: hypothetical protein VJY62_11810 [Bacteroidia bacterium]|nr:hypothetical protein [Bacteroidia bacterium]